MTNDEIIKNDLLTMETYQFYLKHIVKSHNWYFSNYLCVPQEEIIDKMDYFKEVVSSNLKINFHSVQMVGSAKTGYSLSPKKVLQPFHDENYGKESSDIDIAIVSGRLFTHFWHKLRQTRGIYNQYYYRYITGSIFRGYINDKNLQKIDNIREEWDEMISHINLTLQDKLRFEHPITYRIYRSWDDLEEYQMLGINKARIALEGKENV